MNHDLTNGPIIRTMLRFALPMILGDLLQQCYNIADTLIVGRVLGADALAAVGSAFSLMTFLTSILLGLRHRLLHPIRTEKNGRAEGMRPGIVCPVRERHLDPERARLPGHRLDHPDPADPAKPGQDDA